MRQVTQHYEGLRSELESLQQRNMEMMEGRMAEVASHIGNLQRSIQDHQGVINQTQPEQSVTNYMKLQHKQHILNSINQ